MDGRQGVSDEPGDSDQIGKGIGTTSGAQTRGRFEPLHTETSGDEWGIVHLYRDANETPGLYKSSPNAATDLFNPAAGVPSNRPPRPNPPPKDEDCSTLCILAVPSYLSPADFLAFVGQHTREQVSHFRMIRTSRANRYMVLMKFRNGKRAREWQHEWNGKVFNSMEPETCHVVFLKSVEIVQSTATNASSTSQLDGSSTFPQMSNDPFAGTPKPLAPRTPSLIELPTCPVCLERMDETTGLLTILCQHVFHCTCLEKWSGGGCPVCRYTHDDFSTRILGASHKSKSKTQTAEYESSGEPLECETCHADVSLWQCIICGKVGCGRYQGKHAFKHYEETGHNFSIDLESKRVWDYAADVYVHRIIQDAAKPGEKLLELPGRRRDNLTTALDADEDIELAKMENVALEYTHLLTSQLDSQRVYFEDIVQRMTDKASEASKAAEEALKECADMRQQYEAIEVERHNLLLTNIPSLETEKKRLEKRASKFEEMAKVMNAKYMEEKSLASSLLERVKHLEDTRLAHLEKKIQQLEEDNATKDLLMEGLREEHHDAMMQISAQNKLREMVASGELDEEDLVGATIEAGPAAPQRGRGRKQVVDRTRTPTKGSSDPSASLVGNANSEDSGSKSAGAAGAAGATAVSSSSATSTSDLSKLFLDRLLLASSAGKYTINTNIGTTSSSSSDSTDIHTQDPLQPLLDEFRTKLVQQGLLVPVEQQQQQQQQQQQEEQEEDEAEVEEQTSRKKKTKNKGKGKGRKK